MILTPATVPSRPDGQLPAAAYTFDNTAWTLGGPVLIPGTSFNRDRNKLFFFWSQDWLARTDPGGLNQRRMPTALERQGDFSQTRDQNNQLIFVRDPCSRATARPTAAVRRASPTTSSPPTASTPTAGRCSTCCRCRTPRTRPVPTGTTTCSRPCRIGPVTIRWPGWTGTSRRRRPPTGACSSATRSAPAGSRCSARRAAGRRWRRSTRSTRSAT